MLCGTTEVPHEDGAEVVCTADESRYLLQAVEGVLRESSCSLNQKSLSDFQAFGLLLMKARAMGTSLVASRDSEIEVMGRLIAVFGGKWTSAMHLGQEIASKVR